MSWFSKVVWSEGQFLLPQHFQQQDRHAEWWMEARARALGGNFWGFTRLELDQVALAAGKVAISAAAGILPDGTPFDFPAAQPAPLALEIPPTSKDVVVYLALPLRRAQALEVSDAADASGRLARYAVLDAELCDAHGEGSASSPVQLAVPRLVLALGSGLSDAYVRVGVVKIAERRADNSLLLDRSYIPPLLACAVSPLLDGFAREILALLRQRGDALAGRLAHPGAGGVAEIADFLFLALINRQQPLFEHLSQLGQVHPERLFCSLLGLAGELATLARSDRRPEPAPTYQHDALEACFDPVMRELRRGLATVLEQNAIQIELQDHKQGRYVGLIVDKSLLRHAGFVLAVKAQVPGETLRARFPAQAKLGPVERIRDLVNLQLPGIGLRALPVAPRQIPFHAGYAYFELENSGELWKQLDNSGGLGVYVTGDYPGLDLALWAIRA